MAKQIVIESPVLVIDGGWLRDSSGKALACIEGLDEFVHIPEKASRFWLQISLSQWADRSGQRVYIWIDEGGDDIWLDNNGDWRSLLYSTGSFLEELGVKKGTKTKIFFRLLYED